MLDKFIVYFYRNFAEDLVDAPIMFDAYSYLLGKNIDRLFGKYREILLLWRELERQAQMNGGTSKNTD